MLTIGSTNAVRFNVEVHGTSTPPALVRLVIAMPSSELGFIAQKDGDKWMANVTIPEDVAEGQYDIRVEVTVNSRLFTPLKRRVPINKATPVETSVPTDAPPVAPPPVVDVPPVVAPMPPMPRIPEKKRESMFKKIVEDRPPPKKVESATKKKEPIRINIADVVEESNKRFDKVLSESPSYRKPKITKSIVEPKTGTPVSLKKGEVVYE